MFSKLMAMVQIDSSEINPSRELAASRHWRGGLYILATAVLISGLVSVVNYVHLNELNSWVVTKGTLVKAVITGTEKGPELNVTYQYKFGGKTVTATETQHGKASRTSERTDESSAKSLEREKANFESSKNFSICYNPANPTESRISNLDLSGMMMLYAALSGGCAFIFVLCVMVLLNPRKPVLYSPQAGPNAQQNRAILDAYKERAAGTDTQLKSDSESAPDLITPAHKDDDVDSSELSINIKKNEHENL